MITNIETLLGQYVPLNGEGIASLNLEWILGAILFIMFMWTLFRCFLKIVDWIIK